MSVCLCTFPEDNWLTVTYWKGSWLCPGSPLQAKFHELHKSGSGVSQCGVMYRPALWEVTGDCVCGMHTQEATKGRIGSPGKTVSSTRLPPTKQVLEWCLEPLLFCDLSSRKKQKYPSKHRGSACAAYWVAWEDGTNPSAWALSRDAV